MKGILLLNLGSPKSPSKSDVRAYLAQFLMDPEVLDMPFLWRWIVVHAFILPFRPKKTAHAYEQIWTKDGSPLIHLTQKTVEKLQTRLDFPVEMAMRYQEPSVANTISRLLDRTNGQLDHLHVIPMYPQYATSSTKTAVNEVKRCVSALKQPIQLTIQPPFYEDPGYLDVLANQVSLYLREPFDHVLFSYHGLPERHLKQTDPTGSTCLANSTCCDSPNPATPTCYRAQCFATTRGLVGRLGLGSDQYGVSFQSRLGRDPWIRPFTDEVLIELPKKGVKNLVVICPAFTTDCLETLEEIAIRSKADFLNAGGTSFQYVPCLNDDDKWVAMLAEWCFSPITQQLNGAIKSKSNKTDKALLDEALSSRFL